MSKLEKLRSQRDALVAELRSLSVIETEELTEEQDTRATEIEGLLEKRDDEGKVIGGLLKDIEAEERRVDLLERSSRGVGTVEGSQPDGWKDKNFNVNTRSEDPFDLSGLPGYGPKRDSEVRSRALDAVEKSSRYVSDSHKERTTDLIQRNGFDRGYAEFVLLGASDAYADGFLRSLSGSMSGMSANLSDEERHALEQRHILARALGLSDVTGVLVPAHLDTTLILANDGRTNPLRRVARQETGLTNVYTSLTTAGVTHDWTAEAAEVGDNSPAFANPTATAFKGTGFAPISYEAFEDMRGRESELVRLFEDAKDNAEATVFATGNGTSQPRGLITALDANTNAEVANTTSNVFGLEDVYNVYENLPARHRNDRTVWLANLAIINDIRQFGTDSYNTQTVQLGARNVPAVLGHAALEYSAMDGVIGTAGTDNILAVGDPETYLIYDRLGTSVEFVPNLFGTTNGRPTGQRGWVMHHRTGANLTVGAATDDTVVGWRLLQAETNA